MPQTTKPIPTLFQGIFTVKPFFSFVAFNCSGHCKKFCLLNRHRSFGIVYEMACNILERLFSLYAANEFGENLSGLSLTVCAERF